MRSTFNITVYGNDPASIEAEALNQARETYGPGYEFEVESVSLRRERPHSAITGEPMPEIEWSPSRLTEDELPDHALRGYVTINVEKSAPADEGPAPAAGEGPSGHDGHLEPIPAKNPSMFRRALRRSLGLAAEFGDA